MIDYEFQYKNKFIWLKKTLNSIFETTFNLYKKIALIFKLIKQKTFKKTTNKISN